jgi:hypothetical protein
MVRALLVAVLVASAACVPAQTHAHGGVSVEDDICLMKLGKYRSHFTGYQPERRSTQEFCEDIPEVGKVVMVMDFMSDELRTMQTDFRIIRDVKKIGRSATEADLGTNAEVEQATVYYKPPELHPHGTLSASHQFPEGGQFIGIVTATSEDGQRFISVFPFSVGQKSYWPYMIVLLLSALVAFGLYRYSVRE